MYKNVYFEFLRNTLCIMFFFVCLAGVVRGIVYGFVIAPHATDSIITFSTRDSVVGRLGDPFPMQITATCNHSITHDNVDLSFSDSKKLDRYNQQDDTEDLHPCHDIYEKVCSLFDDPLRNDEKQNEDDESEYTTGTFKDMIDVNRDAVHSVISGFNSYHQCVNFYSDETTSTDETNSTIESTYTFYTTFVREKNIRSLFDVWVYGGTSLFKITPMSKVVDKTLYSVDFDLDFDLFFKIFGPLLEKSPEDSMLGNNIALWLTKQEKYKNHFTALDVISTISQFYALFKENLYPSTYDEYSREYIKVKDIAEEYKNIKRVLYESLGLKDDDIVTFNGQYAFFEACFDNDEDDDFFAFIMSFRALFPFFDDKSEEKIRDDDSFKLREIAKNRRLSRRLVDKRNEMMNQLKRLDNKIKKPKIRVGDNYENYCQKMIRKIYFNSVNYKYYVLSNAEEHKDGIYGIVKSVLEMSQNFFENKTGYEIFSSEEMKLHVPKEMAEFSSEKMKFVKIISMASTNKDFIKTSADAEIAYLRPFDSKTVSVSNGDVNRNRRVSSWLNLLHEGLRYRQLNIINTIKNTRSDDYMKNRDNISWHQENTWSTVKAETVNAWYNPTTNFITIPIGITRYPMFRSDKSYDLAFLGAIVGHELGHATDSSGKYFDKFGSHISENETETKDFLKMEKRMKCLVEDYGMACGNQNYGSHTLGEDMADQFGLRMVLSIVNYNINEDNGGILGNEKEFMMQQKIIHRELFVNFAKVWCGRSTYHEECYNANHDVHALSKHRVIKTLRQFPSFKRAFECKNFDPMVNNKTCIIY